MKFKSTEELFVRLKPALVAKQEEILRKGYFYIKIEDIWHYLAEEKWKKAIGLTLDEMANDILMAEEDEIYKNLKF